MIINETNDDTEPVIRVLERQCSEPNPSSTNTLAVPKPTIVKQISQPSEPSPTVRGFFNDELPTSASQVIYLYNLYNYYLALILAKYCERKNSYCVIRQC